MKKETLEEQILSYEDPTEFIDFLGFNSWVAGNTNQVIPVEETRRMFKKWLKTHVDKSVKEAYEELKGELRFHTISENSDDMSKQYVMNTLDFKIAELKGEKE